MQKWKMTSWDVVSRKGYCLFLTLFLSPNEDFLSVSSWTCPLSRHTNFGLIFVKRIAEIFVRKSMNVQAGCPKYKLCSTAFSISYRLFFMSVLHGAAVQHKCHLRWAACRPRVVSER